MKRVLVSILVIGFGLVIVVVSALSVSQPGYAQAGKVVESETDVEASEAGVVVTTDQGEEIDERVDYYLAYPGILPDHPLYFLKMIRDRMVVWFNRKPVERFELFVLYGDKRIGAARVLIEGQKIELGAETALKAEGYLHRAKEVVGMEEVKDKKEKLVKSAQKHREVLRILKDKTEGNSLKNIEQALNSNQQVLDDLGVGVD